VPANTLDPGAFNESLESSRARRALAAIARRRRIRRRGGAFAFLASAFMCAALVSGLAVAKGGSGERASASAVQVLESGDRGSAVAALQRRLRVPADGVFGPQTGRAVKRFQRRRGLTVDGVVGPQTLQALGLARAARRWQAPTRKNASSGERRRSGVRVRAGSRDERRILRRIAACESGGNPRAIGGGGLYRGKYQFSRETWRGVGGRGDPARASEREQDRRALILLRRAGTAPWSNCA